MPNTREKLIELLKKAKAKEQYDFLFGDIDTAIDMPYGAEYYADHLIANGVTIPIRCDECRLHMNCPTEERFLNVKAEDRYCCLGKRKDNG